MGAFMSDLLWGGKLSKVVISVDGGWGRRRTSWSPQAVALRLIHVVARGQRSQTSGTGWGYGKDK
jgi:hypothetical protein